MTSLDLPHTLALSVFTSYFIIIIALFCLIGSSLYKAKAHSKTNGPGKAAFVALTLVSFAHTWFYMFKYMVWSFSDYEGALPTAASQTLVARIADWVHDTSLFEQAWALVCSKPLNWWWSEQLCLFTVGAWTIFIATEGRRHQIKHVWAYMFLGQIVAISVASNLFYLAILLAPPPNPRQDQLSKSASPRIWISVLLSLATVALSPFTSQQTFLPNLLLMHVLLFIPLIPSSGVKAEEKIPSYSLDISTLYQLVHVVAIIIHARTIMHAGKSLDFSFSQSSVHDALSEAWSALYSNPAQSSIGWDIIWTSISFIAWIAARPVVRGQSRLMSVTYLLFATPVASVGVSAPYALQSPRDIAEPAADKSE